MERKIEETEKSGQRRKNATQSNFYVYKRFESTHYTQNANLVTEAVKQISRNTFFNWRYLHYNIEVGNKELLKTITISRYPIEKRNRF